ncbi:MAG: hypothetical protein ACYDAK_13710 [Candidatus Limnocylindrales bacterium]
MSDNSTRDLIIGAALALLLYWHFHKKGGGVSAQTLTNGGGVSAQTLTNGMPAVAPSGAAAAGTSGCGCTGHTVGNPIGLHILADAPAPPQPAPPQFHGAYAGIV